ncbi:MAG: aminotransferase class V-fold PLP-dependent enzyme [Thermomicrobiales bacterium]
MTNYEALGVRRVINASARLTKLGGSLMPPEVLDAMREASGWYVDLFDLQRRVGRRLADLTQNEAVYVSTGASAGLFLSTLACMTGDDLHAIARLPDTTGLRNEVIVHRAQRMPYDPALQLAGGRLVEIGNALQTFDWELEAAFTGRTAAVFYVAGEHLNHGALPLSDVIRIAHAHSVPVIVDAAAQLPPVDNLWRFTRDLGADLVVFSGGKDLRGPQASGMIAGRADLIEACYTHGAPHQRFGRPMKVGKEEMMGLLAAVERYLRLDHVARQAGFEATVAAWIAALDGLPGVRASRAFPNEEGQPVPRVLVEIDPAVNGLTPGGVVQALWEGDPAIAVAGGHPHGFYLTPDCLEPSEEMLVAERVRAVLRSAQTTMRIAVAAATPDRAS